MIHLRRKGFNCPLHFGVAQYLEKLYGNWRGTGHKGLYLYNDVRYKVAEEAEKDMKEK